MEWWFYGDEQFSNEMRKTEEERERERERKREREKEGKERRPNKDPNLTRETDCGEPRRGRGRTTESQQQQRQSDVYSCTPARGTFAHSAR